MDKRIIPILLSGGAGVRLWPMSRELYPKQFLTLCSDKSLLQETALRVADRERFAAPIVVCNHEHRFIIAEQMRQIAVQPDAVILEPHARNTAAACAVGALRALAVSPDALILVLPADHIIRNLPAFAQAVGRAAEAASAGYLATFGIAPTGPETGYGYIRRGSPLRSQPDVHHVVSFTEKPERAVAERYLAEGSYSWNSGMLLLPASTLIDELARYAPTVLDAARASLERGRTDLDFFRLDADAFAQAPSISIDHAVMEQTDKAVEVPCDIDWADVGNWASLWQVGTKDGNGNVTRGDVITSDASDCYIRSEGPLTAVLGLDNVVVVNTGDAVLVAARDRAQNIKEVVDHLHRAGRTEPTTHRLVHRPWGSFQSIHAGNRFQVKCLIVNPGARLSLQKHYHRAEHWIVVQGTALVRRDDEERIVYENESVYLPMGAVHRLENPGKMPLHLIEVQSGSYLGEDDIVRMEDTYGRN
ncbi:mannose-1-phosphate guanylyltransferase/mannose-6-phosphate isomerase [Azospirillum rugosum]|uniref:mannose-1-phosphate guanylyltransferase n=1 Tax=Azospirillum rugosum TaxID=416170 RepID=A0ABS4SHB8_9PROT|nr:mannose-1-phosphate guanylyltransferase/mannose-6-phosphate isomerase [Azospirillum rugosum]MBP2291428.1 mannose-1-phosphate guanylyltransferase/mannose-1-phosphate guanylyltransferase/mannose-6-phosphate isomerase [Azospirillum rugosum]MDQ0525216.1 mannose-1-phosphate guanylyltransferase/mannose-1-phosphate guanylyltransferase/mannose-6-phosphate isomerase [Azospirillum rugosum]